MKKIKKESLGTSATTFTSTMGGDDKKKKKKIRYEVPHALEDFNDWIQHADRRAGLVPKKVTVHPKEGRPFERTQMVRTEEIETSGSVGKDIYGKLPDTAYGRGKFMEAINHLSAEDQFELGKHVSEIPSRKGVYYSHMEPEVSVKMAKYIEKIFNKENGQHVYAVEDMMRYGASPEARKIGHDLYRKLHLDTIFDQEFLTDDMDTNIDKALSGYEACSGAGAATWMKVAAEKVFNDTDEEYEELGSYTYKYPDPKYYDLVKELHSNTQKYYGDKKVKSIKLYRGIGSQGGPIEIRDTDVLSSWTTDREIANFHAHRGDVEDKWVKTKIITATIPVEDILYSYETVPQLKNKTFKDILIKDKEFVVIKRKGDALFKSEILKDDNEDDGKNLKKSTEPPDAYSIEIYDWIEDTIQLGGLSIPGKHPRGVKILGKQLEADLYGSLRDKVWAYLETVTKDVPQYEVINNVTEIVRSWQEGVSEKLGAAFDDLYALGMTAGIIDSGVMPTFGVADKLAMEFIKLQPDRIGSRIVLFAQDIVEKFRPIIANSYTAEGIFDVGHLTRELGKVVKTERYRLERIVRTETASISNAGRIVAWHKDPFKDYYSYSWNASLDNRTKPISLLRMKGGPYTLDEITFLFEHQEQIINGRWAADQYNNRCSVSRTPIENEWRGNRFLRRADFRETMNLGIIK